MTRIRASLAALLPALAVSALLLSGCSGSKSSGSASSGSAIATLTSSCHPSATIVEMTTGPYYTPGAPDRTTISDAATVGIPLVITGVVHDAACQPLAGATLDFWQADGAGVYDNVGYALRGVQTTDAQGGYSLTTVIPGLYPSRTEHVHVTITAPGGPAYTTQLFFPDVPQNDTAGIYSEAMLVTVDRQDADSMDASFDFALP